MLKYIVRRVLLFIPTLIAISLLAFIISVNAPGDPIDRLFNLAEAGMSQNSAVTEKIKQQKRHELGLDLPVFYFSLGTLADIDTAYRIPDNRERETLENLCRKYGNTVRVTEYYLSLKMVVQRAGRFQVDTAGLNDKQANERLSALNNVRYILSALLGATHEKRIQLSFDSLKHIVGSHNDLQGLKKPVAIAHESFEAVLAHPSYWRTYVPVIHFYGIKNQYHRWISGILGRGDFGLSYRDQQPVIDRIGDKLLWSFVLSFLSVFFAYLVSIPLGVYSAYRRGSFFDRSSTLIVFMLYSLPNFFMGTLLLLVFANPDFLNWFPEGGVQDPTVYDSTWPLADKIAHWLPYLVLPLITYTYSSFAFLSRQMRAGMVDILQQDFIRTARAKGLPETKIIWKHAFRNALLPIITIFASVFPFAISGSVIVETIFSIPGMGLEIYESMLSYDYPMIVAIFSLFGVLTLVGYLVSDILYAIADPRISYGKR